MLRTRGNQITWFGHATFRFTTPSGQVIFVDPWIETNPQCPQELKKIEKVDTIFLTHGHFDHIADVIPLAKKFNAQVFCMNETASYLEHKGIKKASGFNKGGTVTVGDVQVTMVHACHSNGIDDDGKTIYAGEPAGLVFTLPGGLRVYHAGDTSVFGDMKIIAELYAPELALLPIGDHYTMGPREAALAIRLLSVKHVVPMHYGTFPVLTGRPETLKEMTQDISGLEIHVMKPGESLAS
jgi:L-ascorbate metabolism protein UlaG (beta-lactamase superfamily)